MLIVGNVYAFGGGVGGAGVGPVRSVGSNAWNELDATSENPVLFAAITERWP